MENLFKNKYRIKSTRLQHYDYSSDGAYYVTICTKNRECWFGDVINGKIKLSAIGEIISHEWQNTEHIRENVILDEWIIMPNHFHAVILIDNGHFNVETHGHASLQILHGNKFGPQSKNLAAIIRGFKGTTTKQIHLSGYENFQWQPRFYEHVIRDERELNSKRQYIINNPLKWHLDKDNPKNNKQISNFR